jgi:hypothetical protein
MGRHNAKLMLSTLWCRQLTRLSGALALGAAKSGLPHRPLDRKTCPSHFDALRTVYVKVFGRRPGAVPNKRQARWPASENLQRRCYGAGDEGVAPSLLSTTRWSAP